MDNKSIYLTWKETDLIKLSKYIISIDAGKSSKADELTNIIDNDIIVNGRDKTDLRDIEFVQIDPALKVFKVWIRVYSTTFTDHDTTQNYLFDRIDIYEVLELLGSDDLGAQILNSVFDLKHWLGEPSNKDAINSFLDEHNSIDEVQETEPEIVKPMWTQPETIEMSQDSTSTVDYVEPETKKKRGRPSIKDVVNKIIDLTTQKPRIVEKQLNDERIVLSYDRHQEKYEVIKDRYEPIGYVEPFKEVIKRGLNPEMCSDEKLCYGVSYKMETPVQRCLRVRKQLADTNKIVENANIVANDLKEQQARLQEQLNNQLKNNNENKGEQK